MGAAVTRSRASAKAAGTRFETSVVAYLQAHVFDGIERRAKTGAKDRGDVSGLRHMGGRLVIEAKDCARVDLAGWIAEAEVERANDDALAGLVVHKRRGKASAGDQYVTLTLADLVALLTGARPAPPTPLTHTVNGDRS
jgi:hypothetical protein